MKRCSECGSTETYLRKGKYPEWIKGLCNKCYCKSINNPRYYKNNTERLRERSRKLIPNRLNFKGKRVYINNPPRSGTCKYCNKSVGDEYTNYKGKTAIIKRTHIHHLEYHPDDPLKDTIELCQSCHDKESWKLKQITGLDISKGRRFRNGAIVK